MFEKSLMGAYCNRLYDLWERQSRFSCYGRIKASSAGKNLNVTNINTKAGPSKSSNRPTTKQLISLCVKMIIWATVSILIMFYLPYTLKTSNGSLGHHSFFLNTSSLDRHDHHYMYRTMAYIY